MHPVLVLRSSRARRGITPAFGYGPRLGSVRLDFHQLATRPARRALRSGPPLCPASLLSPSQICCLGFSLQTTSRRPRPLHWPAAPSGRQVPEFRTRARITLAPPSMPDTHLASQQAPARLIPGQRLDRRVAGGNLTRRPHRSAREPLGSYGSCRPTVRAERCGTASARTARAPVIGRPAAMPVPACCRALAACTSTSPIAPDGGRCDRRVGAPRSDRTR